VSSLRWIKTLGSRLIDLEPEQDGCSEGDGRQEYLWAPVVARRHAAPVFQATEHYLDPVPPFVSTLVVFDGLGSGLPARDARLYALVLRGFTKPIRVIATVGQKPLRRWKVAAPVESLTSPAVMKKRIGRQFSSVMACNLVPLADCANRLPGNASCRLWFGLPLGTFPAEIPYRAVIRRPRPPFSTQGLRPCGAL
jgi:hypothetical protein